MIPSPVLGVTCARGTFEISQFEYRSKKAKNMHTLPSVDTYGFHLCDVVESSV